MATANRTKRSAMRCFICYRWCTAQFVPLYWYQLQFSAHAGRFFFRQYGEYNICEWMMAEIRDRSERFISVTTLWPFSTRFSLDQNLMSFLDTSSPHRSWISLLIFFGRLSFTSINFLTPMTTSGFSSVTLTSWRCRKHTFVWFSIAILGTTCDTFERYHKIQVEMSLVSVITKYTSEVAH